MTITDALRFRQDFYDKQDPSADEEFMFTEAMGTLIQETKKPEYMAELAWFYCGRKQFATEKKYLEMAAECGYGPAHEELGYMWFHGQHGEKDYKKAFEYFSKGRSPTSSAIREASGAASSWRTCTASAPAWRRTRRSTAR